MPRVLVVGAGVAGSAVALLLRRAGWTVEVLEVRSPEDLDAGLFLNLAHNGLTVLQNLGLREHLLTDGHPAPYLVMWSSTGRELGTMPNGPAGDPQRGGVIVRRSWLHEVLRNAVAAAGIPISFESAVTGVQQDGNVVAVALADGTVMRADLVVGADGVRSVVRRHIDPNVSPRYTGLIGLGGFARIDGLSPTPDRQYFLFGRRSFFGHLVRTDGSVWWFANVTCPNPDRVRDTDWASRLRELHAGDPHPVPAVVATADDSLIGYPIETMPELARWSRGRVVAIGDAVHATSPSTGQGAAQALEDAAVLAALLEGLDVPAALTEFERVRRPRIRRIASYAAVLDRQKRVTRSRWGIAVRDAMMPAVLRVAARSTRNDDLFRLSVPAP